MNLRVLLVAALAAMIISGIGVASASSTNPVLWMMNGNSHYLEWHRPEGLRFYYFFHTKQWFHATDYYYSGKLGFRGVLWEFVGDGKWHAIGRGFTYRYDWNNDRGLFKHGGRELFAFSYTIGQWYYKAGAGMWQALSTPHASFDFVGDGEWHRLGNGYRYRYDWQGYVSTWAVNSTSLFRLDHAHSQWYIQTILGQWVRLPPSFGVDAAQGDPTKGSPLLRLSALDYWTWR